MEEIKAEVKATSEGEYGMFAIALSDKVKGSITFSLNNDVWQDNSFPEKGTIVVLSELRKKKAGWRAKSARFLTPDDEKE
ncbi:MAG: hypothetical protein WDZ80_05740 [Candidatus Paceibacterota bacterium]